MTATSTPRPPRPLIAGAGAIAAVLAAILTGCGGGNDTSSSSSGAGSAGSAGSAASAPQAKELTNPALDGASAQSATDSNAATRAKAAGGKASAASSLLGDPVTLAKRVRTANLTVRVKDLGAAASQVRAAAGRLGGSIASEDSQSAAAAGSVAQDVLVVRVPEPKLEDAISAAVATGTELSRSSNSEDVTAVLADLESRESSQRASVARVRALMAKATSLQDIVLLESELSRRETDLEAAEASRRALADQAAQATLTVTLTTTNHPATHKKPGDDSSFMAGLRKSWHALQASTGVLLTIVGAGLPIAIALLIIGWPAYLFTRRARASRAAPKTTPAP